MPVFEDEPDDSAVNYHRSYDDFAPQARSYEGYLRITNGLVDFWDELRPFDKASAKIFAGALAATIAIDSLVGSGDIVSDLSTATAVLSFIAFWSDLILRT